MPRKKKPKPDAPPPAYPLPEGVELTSDGQEDWARLTRLLPFNEGPRLLFVLVEPPLLRRRLADHLAAALGADGYPVARLDFTVPYYQPLQEIFDAADGHPEARFCFLFGLERSLLSPEHRVSALTDLNFHRDQISRRLACPLVTWTTDDTFTDLVINTPDFIAWRGGVFHLTDPAFVVEGPYRQHVRDLHGKLTLYSVTSDAPLAVDLERVFVKLTATQRRMADGRWPMANDEPGSEIRNPKSEILQETTVTLSVSEALRAHPCLSIIGAPGSGKTTLLKYLALTFARHQAQERLELDEERLPVFIALRDFNRFLEKAAQREERLDHTNPSLLPRFLHEHFRATAPHLDLPEDFFARQLEEGRCAVLLDGLDEVADPSKRARVASAVAAFVRHYQGNRFVVTSRPRGYEGETQQRLALLCADCTIRDFDDDDMAEFARSWYTAVTIDQLGDHPTARDKAAASAEDLLRAIRADERVKALAHNPLLLSVLAMVHQRGVGMPQRRAELYDECTDMLLGYWDQTKAARELATYGGLKRSEKRALLEPVALWFHERGEQGLEAGKEELVEVVARQFAETLPPLAPPYEGGDQREVARLRAELFLRVIDERAGLLVERETGVYAFAHLTFQEYLAARSIADCDDYIEYSLRRLHDPWWREVLLLEVGHLSDVRHFGRRARKLTSDLLRAIRHAGSWLEDVLKRDLLFAVRCLLDTGPLGVEDDLRQSLLDELLALWHTTPYEPQRREVVDLFAYAMPTVEGARIRAELLHCLADEGWTLQRRTLRALGQIGAVAATEEVVKQLIEMTADADEEVCSRAARVLGQMGKAAAQYSEVIPALMRVQRDRSGSVGIEAAWALKQIGAAVPTKTLEQVGASIHGEDTHVRHWVLEALGQIEEAAATETQLMDFWQSQLTNTEPRYIGGRYGQVCDIAYEELRRIAGQRGR